METIDKTIMEISKKFNERVALIDGICDWRLRTICYYSLLDSYAQAEAKYNAKIPNGKIFKNFVMKYQKNYDFLSDIDPITLAYELKCKISDIIPSFQPEGCSTIPCKDISINKDVLSPNISSNTADRHSYINLLYVMRNKLIHEQEAPSGINESTLIDYFPHIPFFTHEVSNSDIEGSWVLTIPSSFVGNLLMEVVHGYLDACLKKNIHPFDSFNLTHELDHISWSVR